MLISNEGVAHKIIKIMLAQSVSLSFESMEEFGFSLMKINIFD